MLTAAPLSRFVRRVTLKPDEQRINFRQIDCEVIAVLTSTEACQVTPLMSKIYLCLINTPPHNWEREGVLRFVGEDREGRPLTAWEQLRELTGVANSTLSKALAYMHKVGIIGYDAHKNGVGIRIFINRAVSSIRTGKAQKNLRIVPTPPQADHTPSDGIPFKEDPSGDNREVNINPRAQSRAAGKPPTKDEPPAAQSPSPKPAQTQSDALTAPEVLAHIVVAVKRELEPVITSACATTVASACKREATLNREWFEKAGLPKAIRVAQHEAFNVLRSHGVIAKKTSRSSDVGRNPEALEASLERDRENTRVATFLAETSVLIRQVAASVQASGKSALQIACQASDRELNKLHDLVISGEPSALPEIEARLQAIETEITEALLETVGLAEREIMFNSAKDELKDYALRMEESVFEETVRRRVTSKLREQYRIPRVSLFYV